MNETDLANVTASCAIGPKGEKTYLNIVQGSTGKYGVDLLVNLTELARAKTGGAYTFTNKKGDVIMPLKPKIWPPRQAPTPIGGQLGEQAGEKDVPMLDDHLPF